jgi:hypothetical protein
MNPEDPNAPQQTPTADPNTPPQDAPVPTPEVPSTTASAEEDQLLSEIKNLEQKEETEVETDAAVIDKREVEGKELEREDKLPDPLQPQAPPQQPETPAADTQAPIADSQQPPADTQTPSDKIEG